MEQYDPIPDILVQDPSASQLDRVVIITKMCAADVATNLRRIPVGFYVNVVIGNEEYRTINKQVTLDSKMIEWTDHIHLPSDPSTTIHLRIYASFELGPMLGRGELLRRFSITVRDLIDRSNSARQITFMPKEGEIAPACSSLEVNVCTISASQLSSIVLAPRVLFGPHVDHYMSLATDVGHSHMLRYHRDPQEFHLDRAITQYEQVLNCCPEDHGCRGAALSNLATAKFISCLVRGTYLDLDVPISLHRQALDLRPHDHPDRTFTLINLANALLARFVKRGHISDADEAEELLATLLDMCPANSHEHRSALLVVQASVLHDRADRVVNSNVVAQESPAGSANWRLPYSLGQLYRMFRECQRQDDPQLLNSVVSAYRHAEAYYVTGQPEWIEIQCNLAAALGIRFGREGQEQDLDEEIQRDQASLAWISAGHPGRSILLNNLGTALRTRFGRRGNGRDLDEALQYHRNALTLTPPGHPDRSMSLNNLAYALTTRFEARGGGRDLDEAIQHLCDALALTPTGHPDCSTSLNNLAHALMARFEHQRDRMDLDKALQHLRDALALTPSGHPDRSVSLHNLATALSTRFKQQGDNKDLEEAIRHYRDALALRSTGHPARSMSLNNLATALKTRFEQGGDNKDLNEAIQHHHEALTLRPAGHPVRSMSLNNLASALMRRFERRGDGRDLDKALQHYRHALSLRPNGHPDRSESLNNIATALITRFGQRGDDRDLEEALKHLHDALAIRPVGHPDRSTSLDSLAGALRTRFEHRGNGRDLDEAVQHHRDNLAHTSTGHAHYSIFLNNTATALMARFQHRGDGRDLDEAVQHFRDAFALTPSGHSDRSTALNNLAGAFTKRFERGGDDRDLGEAIQHHRDALVLTPTGHPARSRSLTNLAAAHTRRFEHQGDGRDLDEAVQHFRDALALTPTGHEDRSKSLANLAEALRIRFEHCGDRSDLNEASKLCRSAQTETPSGHPARMSVCCTSAHVHLALWDTSHIATDLDIAMVHYRAAADVEPAGLLRRLESCLAWVRYAEQHQHVSCLDAYTKSLQLLDAHVSATASISNRHMTLKHFPMFLCVDAASCALRQGDVPLALELLEQGRALLWNQLIRFRTPLDDLRSCNLHAELLVKRFQNLSLQLSRQPAGEATLSARDLSRATVEAEANYYGRLVDEWNEVVAEIRTFDGYSRFLLPPLFSDLQQAASEGPIVVLVASKFSCDAIIILHDRPPVHIVLDITLLRLVDLAEQLRKQTYLSRDPKMRSPLGVLRELWDAVMSPVMSKLEEFVERGSRIWWCPTSIFTAFPLHAAGEYRKNSKRSVAAYVSSYTPSLSTLIKARKAKLALLPMRFAAIGQALPDGHQVPLECVDRELDEIGQRLAASFMVFTKLPSAASTKQQALHTLQNNPWIHFSCHGTQNFAEPFKSHLAMRDGPLSLLDIINSNLSKHEFAFLSACKTAVGDMSTLDEAIHLAAGLQFMGVKSVVGTLWSVRDDVAYRLVVQFYRHFCSGGKMDPSRAARALHHAVLSLARDKEEPVALEDRMLFIHIGI